MRAGTESSGLDKRGDMLDKVEMRIPMDSGYAELIRFDPESHEKRTAVVRKDQEGKVIWSFVPQPYDNNITSITKQGDNISAYTWEGTIYRIDGNSGKMIEAVQGK